MSKFDGFINFLEESNERKLVLSFDFIAKLMGCKLCDSAYQYKEYWQPAGHHYQTRVFIKKCSGEATFLSFNDLIKALKAIKYVFFRCFIIS